MGASRIKGITVEIGNTIETEQELKRLESTVRN